MVVASITMFASNIHLSNNDSDLLESAKNALSECSDIGGEVTFTVEEVPSSCNNGNTAKKVTVYTQMICPPPYMCMQPIVKVGSVTFDCNGVVSEVNCE